MKINNQIKESLTNRYKTRKLEKGKRGMNRRQRVRRTKRGNNKSEYTEEERKYEGVGGQRKATEKKK